MASTSKRTAVCGKLETPQSHIDQDAMAKYIEKQTAFGFRFVCYALGGTARYNHDPGSGLSVPHIGLNAAQLSSDMGGNSQLDWSRFVCGYVSPWIDLDSTDHTVRQQSIMALDQELDFAKYINLRSVLLPCKGLRPLSGNSKLALYLRERLWSSPSVSSSTRIMIIIDTKHSDDPVWLAWRNFRTLVDNHHLLSCSLHINADLSDELCIGSLCDRWLGEPVSTVIIPADLMMDMDDKTLMLPNAHLRLAYTTQAIIPEAQLILDCTKHNMDNWRLSEFCAFGTKTLRECPIRVAEHLHDATNASSEMFQGYHDYLQIPLQPLSDNLDSHTYEAFERDPIKYAKYQDATEHALRDLVLRRRQEKESGNGRVQIVIMVLGAGRGPLVATSRLAYQSVLQRVNGLFDVVLYAVEKNDYAYLTLKYRNEHEWDNQVHLIHSDMRAVNVPHKADLIISELLGSFGDNELSPECLDGALHLIKSDAISIPTSYTSFLAPIHSMKLHNAIYEQQPSLWHANVGGRHTIWPTKELEIIHKKMSNAHINGSTSSTGSIKGNGDTSTDMHNAVRSRHTDGNVNVYDQPYIVHLTSCHLWTDTPSQSVFTFTHPNFNAPNNNQRQCTVQFVAPYDTEISGFVGYFSSDLYAGKYDMSIEPGTFSKGMFSWFPTLFMLRTPVLIKDKQTVQFCIKRMVDDNGVWYEWHLLSPIVTEIQNKDGLSYYMRQKVLVTQDDYK